MTDDIRTHYDIRGPQADIVAAILEGRPPQFSNRDARPGFDCLIVVLRRIFSHIMLGPVPAVDWLEASEKENPILRFAWGVFGDEKAEMESATRARYQVFDELPSKGLDHSSSFEELCNSSLMNKTFWSQSEFRLTGILVDINTRMVIEVSSDELADTSLLRLNHVEHPGQPLHEVVSKSFGVVTRKETKVLASPHNPRIVRVEYTPSPDDTIRFGFKNLLNLSIPVLQFKPDDPTQVIQKGWIGYSLLAVVRLKDDKHASEFVRTYSERGENLIGEREPPSIVDNSWSINDQQGKYMLFYGVLPQNQGVQARFPEVSLPRMTENDARTMKRMERFLDSVMQEDSHQQLQPTPPASSIPKLPVTGEMQDDHSVRFDGQLEPEISRPVPGDPVEGEPQPGQDEGTKKRKRKRTNRKRRRDAQEDEVEDRQPPERPQGPGFGITP
ncbi:uncharacterized protein LW93_5131 [Fusarium fujikuroi]|nr:uncharacterized protein LW93_5131 [Fusarium fujikuroi]